MGHGPPMSMRWPSGFECAGQCAKKAVLVQIAKTPIAVTKVLTDFGIIDPMPYNGSGIFACSERTRLDDGFMCESIAPGRCTCEGPLRF